MKRVLFSLTFALLTIVGFSQSNYVVGGGYSTTFKKGDAGTINAEAGIQKGWNTLSVVGFTDARKLQNYSVGANYRLAFGNQVVKPFGAVAATVDLFDDKKFALRPSVGLVISKPEKTPFGLVLYGQGNYIQRSQSFYEGGAKLIFSL